MCSVVATIGGPGMGITTLPLTITTATRMGNPNAACIWIQTTAGTNTDHGFHLLARCCPQAARSRAARIASASPRTPGSTAGSGRWP